MTNNHGFVRVASATPLIRVADCHYNTDEITKILLDAEDQQVSIVVFPELSLTAYTCADLFHQQVLIDAAEESIKRINGYLENKSVVAIIGLPIFINGRLYNVAAVLSRGKIYGFVPKTYLPNYNEYYEKRWFSSADDLSVDSITYAGQTVPVGTDLIFQLVNVKFGIEICEDLWATVPPSSLLALNGAELIFNLSASNELVGKYAYRKTLVTQQSARCMAGYVYAGAGMGESTTDMVFGGSSLIAEDGVLLCEGERFSNENQLLITDVDIDRLRAERMKNTSFVNLMPSSSKMKYREIQLETNIKLMRDFRRVVSQTPFLPANKDQLGEHCAEIFSIQINGLLKRLAHTGLGKVVIGISGGLDSTLALLVLVKVFEKLGVSRKNIVAITMPGFGTTDRTYTNAVSLMNLLNVTAKEIPIREAVMQHFKDIEQDPNLYDTTYENSQARERTQILMDYANKIGGLVIGTGDLSELALGWCTYNGDHMSMYGLNAGIPKTLVKSLIAWVSENHMDQSVREVLADILATPVSPELLPATNDGKIAQQTESIIGPYILHDFFLYYILRFGFSPSKVYFLAQVAFRDKFANEDILKWLKVFYTRFFSQQYKRSALPDGPKIGSVNLSPRADWKMPSDASVDLWKY